MRDGTAARAAGPISASSAAAQTRMPLFGPFKTSTSAGTAGSPIRVRASSTVLSRTNVPIPVRCSHPALTNCSIKTGTVTSGAAPISTNVPTAPNRIKSGTAAAASRPKQPSAHAACSTRVQCGRLVAQHLRPSLDRLTAERPLIVGTGGLNPEKPDEKKRRYGVHWNGLALRGECSRESSQSCRRLDAIGYSPEYNLVPFDSTRIFRIEIDIVSGAIMKVVKKSVSAGNREILDLNEFLLRPLYAHLAHVSADGPRESPDWFQWDGQAIWVIGGTSFPENDQTVPKRRRPALHARKPNAPSSQLPNRPRMTRQQKKHLTPT